MGRNPRNLPSRAQQVAGLAPAREEETLEGRQRVLQPPGRCEPVEPDRSMSRTARGNQPLERGGLDQVSAVQLGDQPRCHPRARSARSAPHDEVYVLGNEHPDHLITSPQPEAFGVCVGVGVGAQPFGHAEEAGARRTGDRPSAVIGGSSQDLCLAAADAEGPVSRIAVP